MGNDRQVVGEKLEIPSVDPTQLLGGSPLSPPGNAGRRKFAKCVGAVSPSRASGAPGLEVVLLQTGLTGNDVESREKIGQRGPRFSTSGKRDHTQKPDQGVIRQLFKRGICREKMGPFSST